MTLRMTPRINFAPEHRATPTTPQSVCKLDQTAGDDKTSELRFKFWSFDHRSPLAQYLARLASGSSLIHYQPKWPREPYARYAATTCEAPHFSEVGRKALRILLLRSKTCACAGYASNGMHGRFRKTRKIYGSEQRQLWLSPPSHIFKLQIKGGNTSEFSQEFRLYEARKMASSSWDTGSCVLSPKGRSREVWTAWNTRRHG
ncbi:hypothetical protein EDB83DRAFT_2317834 [Lactarius deliciosus]|nr:hypothetical protein EDB83DRAFT_2317834 [Lactarius deliciosus]